MSRGVHLAIHHCAGWAGKHRAAPGCACRLVKAAIDAALAAPVMCTASVTQWSSLLYGLARAGKEGVPTPGLSELLGHAQQCSTAPDTWQSEPSQQLKP